MKGLVSINYVQMRLKAQRLNQALYYFQDILPQISVESETKTKRKCLVLLCFAVFLSNFYLVKFIQMERVIVIIIKMIIIVYCILFFFELITLTKDPCPCPQSQELVVPKTKESAQVLWVLTIYYTIIK